jgi:Protein of unknown function (DUF3572)
MDARQMLQAVCAAEGCLLIGKHCAAIGKKVLNPWGSGPSKVQKNKTRLQMRFKEPKPERLDHAGAEAMAAHALAFLAAEPNRLTRFLGDSGMEPQQLAASLAGGELGVLEAALEHILGDESLLLVFASDLRQKPEAIMLAHALLQGSAGATSL